MSLEDAIKELREQIAAAEDDSQEKQEDTTGGAAKEAETSETADEKQEEPVKEEIKEEKPKEEQDNAAFARLRREAAAEKKARLELEAKIAELQSAKQDPADQEELTIAPEITEIVQSHREAQAFKEFQGYEAEFRKQATNYDDVAAEYVAALAQAKKIQNPRMSEIAIMDNVKRDILMRASKYVVDGFNPVEEMYHEAMELGFTGESRKVKKEPTQEPAKEIKPDMKKVAENRARSAGMAAHSGESNGHLTKQAAADLSVSEWAKLTPTEKQRLLYG